MKPAGLPTASVALVALAIRPEELAFSFDHILIPFSFINAPVDESEFAISMFHTVDEYAGENTSVLKLVAARPILEIVFPISEILLPVCVFVSSETTCLSIYEFSFVFVTVRMDNFAKAMRDSVAPVALVHAAVVPVLLSLAVLNFSQKTIDKFQLTRVHDAFAKVMISPGRQLVFFNLFNFQWCREVDLTAITLEVLHEGFSGIGPRLIINGWLVCPARHALLLSIGR